MKTSIALSALSVALVTGTTACTDELELDTPVEVGDDAVDHSDDTPYFHTGHGPARGHEDLVRFAVDMANDYIASYARAGYFPTVAYGDAGPTTSNPLVKGNYETDFPSDEMRAFYDAPDADWHNDPTLANMHSTRNSPGGIWESAHDACVGTKAMITGATFEAARHLAAGNPTEALYWFGHATHTIQDSFSVAHTTRAGDWTMVDVCTYGEQLPGVCYHSYLDLDDRIWRSSWWCQLNPWDRSWGCLKTEARMASLVSAGYLVMVQRYIDGQAPDLSAALDAFFEGDPSYPRSGYFRCNAL